MYRYVSFKEILYSEELGYYTAFGICAYLYSTPIARISDVSLDAKAAQDLAYLLTAEQLDPIQLDDVIEDYLNTI